jgi:hypothetical protein
VLGCLANVQAAMVPLLFGESLLGSRTVCRAQDAGDIWSPTAHEWDMVKRFKEILAKYKEARLAMEGEDDLTITLAFPVVDRLMSDIEAFHDRGQWGDAAIKQALHLSWEGLSRYYRVMTRSVYYVCLFLDPRSRCLTLRITGKKVGFARVRKGCRRHGAGIETFQWRPRTGSLSSDLLQPPGAGFLQIPFLRDIEMSARQQQLQTPPDERERYRRIPFMSTAE